MHNYNTNETKQLNEMNLINHKINNVGINDAPYDNDDNQPQEDNCNRNEVKQVLNCNFCNKHVNPIVKTYTPVFIFILVIFLFIFISFFTLLLLPLLYLTFKQKKYICPLCNRNLISPDKIFKIKKENQILTFQFPKCAIIISVKYLILFLSLIALIFLFYIIRKTSNFNFDNLLKGPYIESSWVDYLEYCGNKSQFRNKFNSANNFKTKFYGNTIQWKGYFHHIKEGFFNSNSLFIKMNPSEYRDDKPDIRCIFNDNLISQVENIQKNDYVEFECTLLDISKNRKPHICLLWHVHILAKYDQNDFKVLDFIKKLSVLNMINNNFNSNPFFTNLSEKNKDKSHSINIVHFSNNGYNDQDMIHDKEFFTMKYINIDNNNPNDDIIYPDHVNKEFHLPIEEEDDEYLDDLKYIVVDNNEYNHNYKQNYDANEYENAHHYARNFESEKEGEQNEHEKWIESEDEQYYEKSKTEMDNPSKTVNNQEGDESTKNVDNKTDEKTDKKVTK